MNPDPTSGSTQVGTGLPPAAGTETVTDPPAGLLPGSTVVGPGPPAAAPGVPQVPGYAVLGEVARGGMGRILAARDPALGREVAVKVLLPGSAGAADRFVREARVTAMLPHPGVPPVHALGTLADGSPFLVMKLVRGCTLADLLRERSSPADGLPRLVAAFEGVCQAVGFAHAQGVVHRDLKPANVMVGAFGEVQVMDWGLAKELAGPAGDGSGPTPSDAPPDGGRPPAADQTAAGAVMGTPAYMAPEQARGEPVDRRADVFALGGTLCAILTGRPPFDGPDAGTTLDLAARADLAGAFARLAACGAEVGLVELCRRCLAADPAGRPADAGATAAAVAELRAAADERARRAEVERGRAEVAAAAERKRRRVVLAAAAAVAAVLAAGAGAAAWQAVRATDAEGRARAEADNARTAEGREREAAGLARRREGEARTAEVRARGEERKARDAEARAVEREQKEKKARETAEEVTGFVQDVLLQGSAHGQASPTRGVNRNLTVKEAMDYAAKNIDGRFKDRPDIEAAVRNVLGKAYYELGAYAEAEPQWARALAIREATLGADHPDTLTDVNNVALLRHARGRPDEAEALFKRALAGREKVLGPDHPDTLQSAHNLAGLYLSRGRYDEAEPLYRRALAGYERVRGHDHTDTLTVAHNLATLYRVWGRPDEAEALFKRALAGRERALGPDHPDTLSTVNNLAVLYRTRGRLDAAEPLYRQALGGYERALGPDHPDTLATAHNLAVLYRSRGRYDEAEPLFERALAGYERARGPDHPDTLTAANSLALLYRLRGRPDEAEPLYKRALAGREKMLGPDHPDTLVSAHNLAVLYHTRGRYDEAEPLYRRALAGYERARGPRHPDALTAANALAALYFDARRFGEAAPLFERCYRAYVGRPGAAPTALVARSYLGLSLLGDGRPAAAEPHLLAGYEGLTRDGQRLDATSRNRLRWVTAGLVEVYEKTDQPERANEWRARLAGLPPEVAPPPREPRR
jgi:tetratricopeptide (TPR) repeat protein